MLSMNNGLHIKLKRHMIIKMIIADLINELVNGFSLSRTSS